MEINSNKKRKVIDIKNKKANCPNCKKKSIEPFTPFCSKKCSDLDLIKASIEQKSKNLKSIQFASAIDFKRVWPSRIIKYASVC